MQVDQFESEVESLSVQTRKKKGDKDVSGGTLRLGDRDRLASGGFGGHWGWRVLVSQSRGSSLGEQWCRGKERFGGTRWVVPGSQMRRERMARRWGGLRAEAVAS